MRKLGWLVRKLGWMAVPLGLVGAAVAQELARPAGQRTWQGSVGGVVPYDLRLPTAARLRERLWAPDDARIITPHVLGVGWGVNFGRLAVMARRRARP